MIKFLISAIFLTLSPLLQNGIYDLNFKTIEGSDILVNSLSGKKIMFVILPIAQNDDNNTFLTALDSLSKAKQNVVFIGVCSYEDGFTDETKSDLKNYYRSILGSQVMITEGMYTRKSATNQHPLFSWLTDKNKNMHFDEEVEGVGQKFFVTESGELKAIYGSAMPLSSSRINRILE